MKTETPITGVAILGTGNIATDLLVKVTRSPSLECRAFLGRNPESKGLARAKHMGVSTATNGIRYLEENPDCADIVFDATSAEGHFEHAPILKKLGKYALDLTPAQIGKRCVPAVNKEACLKESNVSLITCGGQASIPIAHCIGQSHTEIDYVEVISSIASRSAGAATRINLDEYIHTTELGLQEFSGAKRAKAILNLNPATPCINMQTTVLVKTAKPNVEALNQILPTMIQKIQHYVPGYEIILGPTIENERLVVMMRVSGRGDFLPSFAGNLDIITCAAVEMAEAFAQSKIDLSVVQQNSVENRTYEAHSH